MSVTKTVRFAKDTSAGGLRSTEGSKVTLSLVRPGDQHVPTEPAHRETVASDSHEHGDRASTILLIIAAAASLLLLTLAWAAPLDEIDRSSPPARAAGTMQTAN